MRLEKEIKCEEFINKHLDQSLPKGCLEFRSWKSCADIGDIDIYHKVAQSLGQKELTQGFGGLFYYIRVPDYDGQRYGELWTVNLVGNRDQEFLRKFRKHYDVKSLH